MSFIRTLPEIAPYLVLAFVVAGLASLLLTPLVRDAAIRRDFVDRPGGRRINTTAIPRAGGLAVAAAFLLTGAVGTALAAAGLIPVPVILEPGEVVALLAGGAIAALLGLVDDALELRARWQLTGQVALALGAVALGISVPFIANPFAASVFTFGGWLAVGFTVFWIVGMINSINFIDGLDGLSSGIGFIAAVTLAVISITTVGAQPFVALLSMALAGALLGFLRWNFHPASIFAGTSGTMFLGYTLALLAILGTAKVALALLVLGVPIIDTFWIIVRRIATGHAPFNPDRGHIHHRLLDLGLSHRQTVLFIYAVCAGLAALSLLLSGTGQLYAFVGLGVVTGFALLLLTRGGSGDSFEAESYEEDEAGRRQGPAAVRSAPVAVPIVPASDEPSPGMPSEPSPGSPPERDGAAPAEAESERLGDPVR